MYYICLHFCCQQCQQWAVNVYVESRIWSVNEVVQWRMVLMSLGHSAE